MGAQRKVEAAGQRKAAAAEDTSSTKLGMSVKKAENFAQWYTEVITKAELVDYYDVSGCYILRPWIFYVWECVQKHLDGEFQRAGIKNAYFPMFVTKARLEAEQDHVEGFSAEVAWVTKSGSSDLQEPIAIRPTSETIIYPSFQKWIRSHRDLPLKINQWCPVVRWEFSHPTPFIRTREFLWQEGHTAHLSIEEADEFARRMLNVYVKLYEDLLAIPVTPGQKSELEKFAGGLKTYTVEAYVDGTGRSVQAATSHNLGENFAKIFDVVYEDDARERHHVGQTSFGLSTRSLGTMIMIHGDDQGLVLPPRCAPIQVVIVPIIKKDADATALNRTARELYAALIDAGIRAECDDRAGYNPGWKYNHWELKGVPLRLEVGPRDLEQGTCRMVRRCDRNKEDTARDDTLIQKIRDNLQAAHDIMLARARRLREESIVRADSFADVMPALAQRKLLLTPWCRSNNCEEFVKKETARLSQLADTTLSGSMKTLCMPFEQPELAEGTQCFACDSAAQIYCLWGRSY